MFLEGDFKVIRNKNTKVHTKNCKKCILWYREVIRDKETNTKNKMEKCLKNIMNKEFTDEFFKMYWKVENLNWTNNF